MKKTLYYKPYSRVRFLVPIPLMLRWNLCLKPWLLEGSLYKHKGTHAD